VTGLLRRAAREDDGRVALLVLVMAFGVLVMIGLSVDGGGKMRAIQRADNIAAEAARAGGQAIQLDQAAAGGEKVPDPAQAVAQAQNYLAAAGVEGTVTLTDDGGQQIISVTVTTTYNTQMLGLIGINQLSVTGTGSAQLLTG
jgi:Flp pilus assembly protein TadG